MAVISILILGILCLVIPVALGAVAYYLVTNEQLD
jgi:hypothetical protein